MRLHPDDPTSEHGRRGRLQGLGLLPNPNGFAECAAMPMTTSHILLSFYENLIRQLGDEFERALQDSRVAHDRLGQTDRHLRRAQDALAWLQSEYELDNVAHDVINYARSGQDA